MLLSVLRIDKYHSVLILTATMMIARKVRLSQISLAVVFSSQVSCSLASLVHVCGLVLILSFRYITP